MKSISAFCAIVAVAIGAQTIPLSCNSQTSEETSVNEVYSDTSSPTPGMFFNSANVVEEFEYDDAYCLLYDDADANMYNAEICVDLETYQMVADAVSHGRELVGSLVLNDDYTTEDLEVYTFMSEPESEMADASAKL